MKSLKVIDKKLLTRKKGISELLLDKTNLEASIKSLENDLLHIPKYMVKTSVLKMRTKKDPYCNITIPKTVSKIDSSRNLIVYPRLLRTLHLCRKVYLLKMIFRSDGIEELTTGLF